MKTDPFDRVLFSPLTEAPKDLIRKLLVVDPKKRISIDEALEHPFFHIMVLYRKLLFIEVLFQLYLLMCCLLIFGTFLHELQNFFYFCMSSVTTVNCFKCFYETVDVVLFTI